MRVKVEPWRPAERLARVEISLIRQINALATPLTINLGIGEPNLEPDATLREMAARVARHGSWHYSPNAGHLQLRQKVGELMAPAADPRSEICITAGTEEGLFSVLHTFVDRGDEVLVPDPGFTAYSTIVGLAGGTPVPYSLDPEKWDADLAEIERLLTPRTRVILVNSPSNPTGANLPQQTLSGIAKLAGERGIVVISDEVYREIHYGDVPVSMIGMGSSVIVVSGLSKSHSMTGLRLGWIIAPEKAMASILKVHQYVATCASAFAQDLALAIFENVTWNRNWLDHVRERFGEQREAAMRAIERSLHVSITPPAGAFYAFVPVPVCDTVSFARGLATEAAVLAIPGLAFGKKGEGFLRISFAASLPDIKSGIERIGRYLDEQERR